MILQKYDKLEKLTRWAYIDSGKLAAARFAITLIRSALDATATLRPFPLHCFTAENTKRITK